MFIKRLISGIILVIIAGVTIIAGGNVLFGTVLAISLIGQFELYRVLKIHDTILGAIGYAMTLLFYGLTYMDSALIFPAFIGFFLLTLALYVFRFPVYSGEQVMATIFGFVYVPLMLSFIYKLRIANSGYLLVWIIVLASWGNDTCAYCIGMLFGKHKMAPKLSPKKSIEGAIGGLIGAGALGFLYGFFLETQIEVFGSFVPIACMILCVTGGFISIVGDLAASAIKRNYEIKDYGYLIPGHGGILDRFDSMIFTGPVIYYVMMVLMFYLK